MKGLYIYDTESDGLAGKSVDPDNRMTKFHCMLFKEYKKDNWALFLDKSHPEYEVALAFVETKAANVVTKDMSELDSWLAEYPSAIACQNQFGFDLKAFAESLGFTYSMHPESVNGHPMRLYDTLSMSRLLWPDRLLPRGCPSKVKNPLGGPAKTIGPHSLEAWGYKLANQKVAIEDWRGLMVWKYVDRVWEDVIINELQWEALVREMTTELGEGVSWVNAMKRGTVSDYLMAKQEEQGVVFDKEGAERLLVLTDNWMEGIEEDVEPKLPLKNVPKSDVPTFPKEPFSADGSISHYGWAYARKILGYELNEDHFSLKPPPKTAFKKDGSLGKAGENYCIKQGVEDKEAMPDFIRSQIGKVETSQPLGDSDYAKLRQQLTDKYMPEKWLKAPMKISNQGDIKEWLVREGGWRPTIFNTKDVTRNEFKQNRKEDDIAQRVWEWIEDKRDSLYEPYLSMEVGFSIKSITSRSHKWFKKAIRKGRFLPTTPKFKDERGKLCPTLREIDEGMAGQIVKWLSLRNRRSVIKSKDEKKTTGWLNHPRLKVDGKLPARYSGLTNTFRRKHSVIANVPGSEALLGHEMRSLFTVPDGFWQLGIDGSNLEGMCAAWAAYPFDNGAYLEIMESGDAHARNAEAYSKAAGTMVTRQGGKGITYGIMYGAQKNKIAVMLNVTVEKGQEVIDAFWDSNIGLKKCREFLEKQWDSTGKKYIIGVDGRKVHTRSKHSLLNCYLQSAGAIGMDLAGNIWHEKMKKEGLLEQGAARTIFYHDEYQLQVPDHLMRWKRFSTGVEGKEVVDRILHELDDIKTNKKKGKDFKSFSDLANEYKLKEEDIVNIEGAKASADKLEGGKFLLSANTYTFENGDICRNYSRVGVLMVEAIEEAYQQLDCPVHITGEYLCGKNWSETH